MAILTASLASCAPLPPRTLPETTTARRALYGELVRLTACRHGIEPALLDALVIQESSYRTTALSPKGAIGLGQLMPGTAKQLGVNPNDTADNLNGAARYLKMQLRRFGSVKLALAAYNAGPHRVQQYGGVPPFAETRAYIAAIERHYSGTGSGPQTAEGGSGFVLVNAAVPSIESEAVPESAAPTPPPPKWDVFARFAWEQAEARKSFVEAKEEVSDEK